MLTESLKAQRNSIGTSPFHENVKRHFEKRLGKLAKGLQFKKMAMKSEVLSIKISDLENKPVGETLSLVNEFKAHPEWVVEPDYRVETQEVRIPNDPYFPPTSGAWGQNFSNQWPLEKLDVLGAWATSSGAGVTVAVIDTGVDYNHPELRGKVINGYDFVNRDSDPMDDNGHGTHVAGTIAANTNNGIGIAGVAPQANILAIKVLDSTGGGSLADVTDAITYAVNNGAKIINMSLGGPAEAPQYLTDALDYAHEHDVLVVVAAGNSNEDLRGFIPASDPVVVSVAATNHNDQRAYFSNYGLRLGLSAPGGGETQGDIASILSLKSTVSRIDDPDSVVGEKYLRLAGTSMAAPHVAAVAALLRSKYPTYSSEQIRQMLLVGSDDITLSGFDAFIGAGRLNAKKALSVANPLEVFLKNRVLKVKGQSQFEIRGKVGGENLKSWELRAGLSMVSERETISRGQSAIEGIIGNWDLTKVPDGEYIIELIATDRDNRTFSSRSDLTIQQNEFLSPEFHPSGKLSVLSPVNKKVQIKAKLASFATSTEIKIFDSNFNSVSNSIQVLQDGIRTEFFEASLDVSKLKRGSYQLQLMVFIPGGSVSTIERKVVFEPSLKPGWPKVINNPFQGSLRTGLQNKQKAIDLDGNGKSSLFFDYAGKTYVLGPDGQPRNGWPVSYIYQIDSDSAAGDINGDGSPEIVTCYWDRVYIFNKEGSPAGFFLLPSQTTHGSASTKTILMDLDFDGKQDILCPLGNKLFAYNYKGESFPDWPVNFSSFNMGNTKFAVIRSTEKNLGIFVLEPRDGSSPAIIHAINEKGQELPGWPQKLDYEPFSSSTNFTDINLIATDINQDGKSDLIIKSLDGIQILDNSGSTLPGWPYIASEESKLMEGVAIGDIDGDGFNELVVIGSPFKLEEKWTFSIMALDLSGRMLPHFPILVPNPFRYTGGAVTPALVDLDGDGKLDIVGGPGLRQEDKFTVTLPAFNYLGQQLPGFPKIMGSGVDGSQTLGVLDLDGDGKLELVVTDQDLAIYAWELGVTTAAKASLVMSGVDAARSFSLPLKRLSGHPTNVFGEEGNTQVKLSWEAPANNGGNPITDYLIQYSSNAGKSWSIFNDGTSVATKTVVTNLSNGVAYIFRVAAVNSNGTGSFSENSSSITPSHVLPGAPTNVKATSSHGQVHLSWSVPVIKGTGGITDYVIQYSSNNGKSWATFPDGKSASTSVTVVGLKLWGLYSFKIAAVNSIGQGSFSTPSKKVIVIRK